MAARLLISMEAPHDISEIKAGLHSGTSVGRLSRKFERRGERLQRSREIIEVHRFHDSYIAQCADLAIHLSGCPVHRLGTAIELKRLDWITEMAVENSFVREN